MRGRAGLAVLAAGLLVTAIAGCGSGSDGGGSGSGAGGGKVSVVVWHGWTDTEGKEFNALVKEYNAQHPDVNVTTLYLNNDYALQKVLTAVSGGTPPDVAYLYGSWAPSVAKIPLVVDLTEAVKAPGVDWADFPKGESDVATVNGKVIGMPALVDNLAIVYNKKMFAAAGVPTPTPTWTWTDFENAARAMTNPSQKQFGWTIPADGSEDTVWHWEAMLWEAGGQLLSPDNKQAAFNSPQGVQALTTLRDMAVTDKSVFLDTSNDKSENLFNAGKVGMIITGPWDLSSFPKVDYGVQIMPAYEGSSGGHQTIAGPDNWVVFNNGDARAKAATDFVLWLTAKEQVKAFSLATGDLPTRESLATDAPFVASMDKALPGVGLFINNLANVQQARPQVTTYPKISEILGNAIVSVMLNKSDPQSALTSAATQVNQVLATGS
jgi:multiple sugar transport system substrate-binding protein